MERTNCPSHMSNGFQITGRAVLLTSTESSLQTPIPIIQPPLNNFESDIILSFLNNTYFDSINAFNPSSHFSFVAIILHVRYAHQIFRTWPIDFKKKNYLVNDLNLNLERCLYLVNHLNSNPRRLVISHLNSNKNFIFILLLIAIDLT